MELYKTADMEAALSRLYAGVLMFFRLCARWYSRGSWGRLWSSFKNPFELKYKDLVVEIERASGTVENLAIAGARVEVRNIHALTTGNHAKLVDIDTRLKTAFDTQTQRLDSFDKCISSISDGQAAVIDGQVTLINGQLRLENIEAQVTQIYNIVQTSQSVLNQTHRAVYRLEFHHILEFFTPKTLPGSALQKVKPLAQRRPLMSNQRLESMLRAWASNTQSPILVLSAAIREQKQANELAADVVNHLRSNGQFVFWSISAGVSGHHVAMEDVFKSIIYQALQQWGAAYADLGEQLHPHKMHATHTDGEWVDLICLLFSKLPSAFVVLETKDLRDSYGAGRDWTTQLLEHLQAVVDRCSAAQCRVKVLLLVYGPRSSIAPPQLKESVRVVSLQQTEIPARLKNKAGHPSVNMKGWGLRRPLPPRVQ